jgi:hypothetical protein
MNEVGNVLSQINDAWRTGNPDLLADYFHPEMVIVGPCYQELGKGREACVASYRDFLIGSVVKEYRESNLVIKEWGATAVATYNWEMEFEQDGLLQSEAGADLFVFDRQGEKWLAVWRAITFSPKAQ